MQVGNTGICLAEGICLVFLCICTVFDIKKREMPISILWLGMVIAACFCLRQIAGGSLTVVQAGASLLPGTFFLLVSRLTGEQIGSGDGIMLVMIGLFIGSYRCVMLLCVALIASTVFASFLLVFRKAKKDSKIPFVPFLAIGMGVIIWI